MCMFALRRGPHDHNQHDNHIVVFPLVGSLRTNLIRTSRFMNIFLLTNTVYFRISEY